MTHAATSSTAVAWAHVYPDGDTLPPAVLKGIGGCLGIGDAGALTQLGAGLPDLNKRFAGG